uniref:Phospholipase A1-Igamma1, chloroplastic n=1 Tax=Anthurium amnicola TaxID=1678845 RepID=A0A1D1XX57_9ARAE
MAGLPVAFWDVPQLRPRGHGLRLCSSPKKEDISAMWPQLHGSDNWDGLLDPLNPSLRDEIIKYGEFCQVTYDAYNFDVFDERCGGCRGTRDQLLNDVDHGHCGYEVTRLLFATMSEVEWPDWIPYWLLQWVLHMESRTEKTNWMGFVAVSNDEETKRLGRREIVVAWRGTCGPCEWYKDAQFMMQRLVGAGSDDVEVDHGFLSVYTSRGKCNRQSASEQAMEEIRRLVGKYGQEGAVSLTVTGHSLGGALAVLNAHEAAAASIPGLTHVSVVSFAAPRVGNAAFGEELARVGVKLLRVVINEDVVPDLPPAVFLGYQHAGVEMDMDIHDAPDLDISWIDVIQKHSLKTYLHLVELNRRASAVSLLVLEAAFPRVQLPSKKVEKLLRARECWYRMADLGIIQGPPGWPSLERDPKDDVPVAAN